MFAIMHPGTVVVRDLAPAPRASLPAPHAGGASRRCLRSSRRSRRGARARRARPSTSRGGKATTTTTQPLTGFAAQSPQAILAAGCGATQPLSSVAVATTFSKPSLVGGVSSMAWSMSTAANEGTLHYGKKIIGPSDRRPLHHLREGTGKLVGDDGRQRGSHGAWRPMDLHRTGEHLRADRAPMISFSNLSSLLTNCLPTGQQVIKGQLGSVGSEQTINVAVQAGFTTQTLSIPTTSIPYILKSVMLSAQVGQETSLLSGFNAQKAITAPATSTSIETALAG